MNLRKIFSMHFLIVADGFCKQPSGRLFTENFPHNNRSKIRKSSQLKFIPYVKEFSENRKVGKIFSISFNFPFIKHPNGKLVEWNGTWPRNFLSSFSWREQEESSNQHLNFDRITYIREGIWKPEFLYRSKTVDFWGL